MTAGTVSTAEKLRTLSQQLVDRASLRAARQAAQLAQTNEALALLLLTTKVAVIGDAPAERAWRHAFNILDSAYRDIVEEHGHAMSAASDAA